MAVLHGCERYVGIHDPVDDSALDNLGYKTGYLHLSAGGTSGSDLKCYYKLLQPLRGPVVIVGILTTASLFEDSMLYIKVRGGR